MDPKLEHSIRFVQKTRNSVAHDEAYAVGKGIELRPKKLKNQNKKLELSNELMREVEKNMSLAVEELGKIDKELFLRVGVQLPSFIPPK